MQQKIENTRQSKGSKVKSPGCLFKHCLNCSSVSVFPLLVDSSTISCLSSLKAPDMVSPVIGREESSTAY